MTTPARSFALRAAPQALYPADAAFRSHALAVPGGHVLHVDEFGRADGIPALVLHGGPGSGCSPLLRRFFDPQRYRIICPDQRGAGRSQPRGETAHNTTADLLADLRLLREHLGIARWLVVGGSWGATLAIAHAADLPQAVTGLVLRAVFLARAEDIASFFRSAPEDFIDGAAIDPRRALAWWRHEQAMAGTAPPEPTGLALAARVDPPLVDPPLVDPLIYRYRVQAHYLRHRCWLEDRPLLDRCDAVPPVPTLLLHGSADRVCPPAGAQLVHERIPGSRLQWVADAGHDPAHPAMAAAMLAALDHVASEAAR